MPALPPGLAGVADIKKKTSITVQKTTLLFLHEKRSAPFRLCKNDPVTSESPADAVIVPARAITVKFKTCHLTSSTPTELATLRASMQFIVQESSQEWLVVSDTKAILNCLTSSFHHGFNKHLMADITLLHHHAIDKDHSIAHQWTPGHCGIYGNDSGDKVAQRAQDGIHCIALLSREPCSYKSSLDSKQTDTGPL